MTDLTEETAINLLEAILMLNAKIDDLDELLKSPKIPPSTPTPPQDIPPAPTSLPEGKMGKDQTEIVMSAGPKIKHKDGTEKPSYFFIGGPEYDVTKNKSPETPAIEPVKTKDCEHDWKPIEGTTKMVCSKCKEEMIVDPIPQEEPEPAKKIKGEDRVRSLAKKIKGQVTTIDQKDNKPSAS
jgi:hypothetical protein